MMSESRSSILDAIDSKTKLLALIALIAEGAFVASLVVMPPDQVLYGLIVCAIILIVCIIGIVIIDSKNVDKTLPNIKNFNIKNAIDFYNTIAKMYDERNSKKLLESHRRVIEEIENHLNEDRNYNILDLGGGTGKLITNHFFNKENITWTYVDKSTSMIKKFQEIMDEAPLRTEIIVEDIDNIHNRLKGKKFDVIIISWVLSSMPHNPDFSLLKNLLADNGILIITDNDQAHSSLNPYYDFIIEGESYALEIRPINPLELEEELTEIGYKRINSMCTKDDRGGPFSFQLTFK